MSTMETDKTKLQDAADTVQALIDQTLAWQQRRGPKAVRKVAMALRDDLPAVVREIRQRMEVADVHEEEPCVAQP